MQMWFGRLPLVSSGLILVCALVQNQALEGFSLILPIVAFVGEVSAPPALIVGNDAVNLFDSHDRLLQCGC